MALHSFGGGPAEVTTDSQGNVVGGVDVKVYTAHYGGQQVTELYDFDGNILPGIVRSVESGADEGRIMFQASDAYAQLFVDSGTGGRWVVPAVETFNGVMGAISAAEDAQETAQTAIGIATDANEKSSEALDLINSGDVASNQNVKDAVGQLQTIMPTTDELTDTIYIPAMVSGGTLTSTMVDNTEIPLWVAPFPATILSVGMVFESFTSPTPLSDADYVNFYLLRRVIGDATRVAARSSTDLEWGSTITAGQGWEWDKSFYWEENHQTLAKSEVLSIKSRKYGAHADIPLPVTITLRYRPL